MRPWVLGCLLLLAACREDAERAPARAGTAAPRPPAAPARPGLPPEPPPLRGDQGDCSARHAPRPDRDRFPMCVIPAGTFDMGYQPGEPQAKRWPSKRVSVEAFLLDQVEVTTAQYIHFLRSLGREGLTNERLRDGWWGGKAIVQMGDEYHLDPERALRPMNVTWEAARRYCEWAGKRLPTGAEWEFAARFDPAGKRMRRFPWGDRFDEAASGCDETSSRDSPAERVDVGLFDGRLRADGRSATGVYDLLGNADEWVADSCSYSPERCHVIRGGVYCFQDSLAAELSSYYHGGFRCAANQPGNVLAK